MASFHNETATSTNHNHSSAAEAPPPFGIVVSPEDDTSLLGLPQPHQQRDISVIPSPAADTALNTTATAASLLLGDEPSPPPLALPEHHTMTTTTTTGETTTTNNACLEEENLAFPAAQALTTTQHQHHSLLAATTGHATAANDASLAAASFLLAVGASDMTAAASTTTQQQQQQPPNAVEWYETHAQKKAKLDENPMAELKRKAEKYASVQQRKRKKGDEAQYQFHTTHAKQQMVDWLLSVRQYMPLCYHVDKKGLHTNLNCTCLATCNMWAVADVCVKHCLATPNARDMQLRMLIQEADERASGQAHAQGEGVEPPPRPFWLRASASSLGTSDTQDNGDPNDESPVVRLCLDSFLNLFKVGGTKYESMKRANEEGVLGQRRHVGSVNRLRNNARRQAEPHVIAFLQGVASRHNNTPPSDNKDQEATLVVVLPETYNRRNLYRDYMWQQGYQMIPGASSKRSAPVLSDFKPRTDEEWTTQQQQHTTNNTEDKKNDKEAEEGGTEEKDTNTSNSNDGKKDQKKKTKEAGSACSIFCFVSIWEASCPHIQIQSSTNNKKPLSNADNSVTGEGDDDGTANPTTQKSKKPRLLSDQNGNPYTALREAHEMLVLEMQHLREQSREERDAHQQETERLHERVQYLESHLRLSSQRVVNHTTTTTAGGSRF